MKFKLGFKIESNSYTMGKQTCYILEFGTAAPTQINFHYLLSNLTSVKRTLCHEILDFDSLDLFVWDGSEVYLYLIQQNQLIAKYDVKPWIKIIFEDIAEIGFNNGELLKNYFSQDKTDRDFVDCFTEFMIFEDAQISDDFTRILMNCTSSEPIDGFDGLEIIITYPDLPELDSNTCSDIYLPREWYELPSNTKYDMPKIMCKKRNEDDLYLSAGYND